MGIQVIIVNIANLDGVVEASFPSANGLLAARLLTRSLLPGKAPPWTGVIPAVIILRL